MLECATLKRSSNLYNKKGFDIEQLNNRFQWLKEFPDYSNALKIVILGLC